MPGSNASHATHISRRQAEANAKPVTVQDFLKKSGYKGLLLKPRKNNQDNCPAVIYEPNAFDPSTPPPVLA